MLKITVTHNTQTNYALNFYLYILSNYISVNSFLSVQKQKITYPFVQLCITDIKNAATISLKNSL